MFATYQPDTGLEFWKVSLTKRVLGLEIISTDKNWNQFE